MSESGVIPRPPDRGVREIGRVADRDGVVLCVCIESGTVRLEVGGGIVLLPRDAAEEFAQLFVSACWQARPYADPWLDAMPP